jgi:hypothetical protein
MPETLPIAIPSPNAEENLTTNSDTFVLDDPNPSPTPAPKSPLPNP